VRLVPRADLVDAARVRPGAETAPQRGTPYGMQREFLLSPSGLPCNAPPWGTLSAIDLTTGERVWERPLGSMKLPVDIPGSGEWGSLNLGGAMNTAGGLVFASGGFDEKLHAFDAETGRELWSAALPAGGNASPMSYVVGGRQFVVIAAGGHDRMGTAAGDYVVAFALPSAAGSPAGRPEAPLPGRFKGQFLVGDGRFPVSVELGSGGGADLSGTVVGAISGPLAGRIEGESVTVEVPFTLPAEGCTGKLRGRLQRANRGRMLVGPVRVSGGCSDGGEEEGVLALRRSDP
jgi:outer membrane protein assembly factor BamB